MEKGIILGNRILDVVFVAWFLAQSYKVASTFITEKKIVFRRFWETGGMPSSHSSTVSALATAIGIVYGTGTAYFAISVILAIIVIHDAAGIRRAAGEQASVLNQVGTTLSRLLDGQFNQVHLKELLGHTPFEVLIGTLLGIAVAFGLRFYLIGG